MKWYYEIRGSNSRLVESSKAEYDTEKEALAAGGAKAKIIVSPAGAPGGNEILSVMAGRK
jgi:hypothetical protein